MQVEAPDFDVLYALTKRIGELVAKKRTLEDTIKSVIATSIHKATMDKDFWIDNKRPAMNYLDVVTYNGLYGELVKVRQDLAAVCGELETSEKLFEVLQMQLQLYQTQSADRRNGY
jgi:hypothetical protein